MCEGHHVFDWIPSFLCQFMLISSSTPLPLSSDAIAEWPVSKYVVLLWVVFCVMTSWVNGRKYENPLQFNTSLLASLRMWFYFRLCFSFTCSGYDSPTPLSTALFQYTFDRLVLLSKQVTGNKDILIISETYWKLLDDGFSTPYLSDRDSKDRRIGQYVREDIPSNLLEI